MTREALKEASQLGTMRAMEKHIVIKGKVTGQSLADIYDEIAKIIRRANDDTSMVIEAVEINERPTTNIR